MKTPVVKSYPKCVNCDTPGILKRVAVWQLNGPKRGMQYEWSWVRDCDRLCRSHNKQFEVKVVRK